MRWLLIIEFLVCCLSTDAQTCCSGGVPISSNLGMPMEDAHILQMNVSYDLNTLNTLKTGREVIKDRNRTRRTHSMIWEASYGFTKRFSADLLFSYVRQERTVNNFGRAERTRSQGFGDVTFLLKYEIISQPDYGLSGGIGLKLPSGSSTEANENGIRLNADLQPGSGAMDLLLWSHFSSQLKSRPSTSIFTTLIFAGKGHNETYLGVQDYKFGDELQVILGIGDRMFFVNQIFDPSVAFRYRYAASDQNNDVAVPSTGGQWIFINPSLSWWPNTNISWNINFELPLLANITGTQVSPTLRLNTGLYYKFTTKDKN
ncbi:MAG: hypothetical protein HKN87_23240 [Saprospiraceae bacterium]|nr:hypothetical protein [Saprospiraceae bacterium]